jgi:hypothetical protein
MQTRSGTEHLPTSRIFSPYARPTAMTRQQTVDLRAQHTSVTTHPLAATSPPTPRVISHVTFILRAWRNHLRRLESIVRQTQPHAHLYHQFLIPSRFYKPNLQSKASRYRKSWHRMQNLWQHSPRVAVVATAGAAAAVEAKAAAATMVVGTKPHEKRKNSAPTARRWLSMIPWSVSPLKRTRTNAPRDGAPKVGNDRDRGPRIMTQY